jgi:hypothetical protein
VGVVLGVVSVEGVTDVPADDSVSPNAETPGAGALGPTLIVVVGAGAFAAVAGEGVIAVDGVVAVEAGAVPVGVDWGDGEIAGAVPDGVRMSAVAEVGAEKMVSVGVAPVELPAVVVPAAVVVLPPGVVVEVPM